MNILLLEPDIYKNVNFKKIPNLKKIFFFKKKKKKYFTKINAIFTGLKYPINNEFIKNFKNLKYIVTPTTGLDHIQIENDNIKIINLNPKEIPEISATAEHTLLLILIMLKKIPHLFSRKFNREKMRSNQLSKKRILIIGRGRIGRKLGNYCKILNMKVFYYDKNYSKKKFYLNLMNANIISININSYGNKNFFSKELFSKCKSFPYLINTSRPQVVEKKYLYDAIDKRIINGYAMDFSSFDDEKKNCKIKKYIKNGLIFTTPHIAGNTHESISISSSKVFKKFLRDYESKYK